MPHPFMVSFGISAFLDLFDSFRNLVTGFFNFIYGTFTIVSRAASGIIDFFGSVFDLFGVLTVGVPSIFLTFAFLLLAVAAIRIVIELL